MVDSTEHTASEGPSSPASSRRLKGAIVLALALIALGWLVLSVQTASGPAPGSAPNADPDTRNAQGPIRMRPLASPAQGPEGSTAKLAGMKLEQTLRNPVPAKDKGADPAAAAKPE